MDPEDIQPRLTRFCSLLRLGQQARSVKRLKGKLVVNLAGNLRQEI